METNLQKTMPALALRGLTVMAPPEMLELAGTETGEPSSSLTEKPGSTGTSGGISGSDVSMVGGKNSPNPIVIFS